LAMLILLSKVHDEWLRRLGGPNMRGQAMEDVSLTHAKDHLEELIERAAKGEDIRISDPKLGTVRLQPVSGATGDEQRPPDRRPGRWKGRFTVPERLFEPLTDEELAWLAGERSK